jgi:hypothetical protein
MNRPAQKPDTVSLYVREFQRRLPEFERGRRREQRAMKHDFVARFFTEHFVLGDKVTYDGLLQGMLNEQELERLERDPKFTRAWRIFVDLCWLKRQLTRAGLILGAIVLVFAVLLFLLFAIPQVAGPDRR